MSVRSAALALSMCWFTCVTSSPAYASRLPNLMVILADDQGYSDLGCFGGEIETPNLDALAAGGLRFTQFANTARCWPTRAAILTGYYAQQVRRDSVPGAPSGGAGERPEWARLLPEMLRSRGYRSYHSGKWHIDGLPISGGFDRSYALMDQGRFFSPRTHFLNDEPLPPVDPGSGYYATTAIADHAIDQLKDHAAHEPETPFFQYIAFTAPHFPLHALPEDIERYRERYRAGWETVRDERWARLREIGIVGGHLSKFEPDVGPPYHFPDALNVLGSREVNRPILWAELSDRQRDFQSTKMAIHAAMIDRMDREIGRVLDQLRGMGAFEDTLILFLSDNGASAEIMVRDDGHDPAAPAGSAASHLCLGPGWSTVANTPFRLHKTWVHQGGIATPLIAHWPNGFAARDELRHTPGHVIDIVPTLLEAGGVDFGVQDGPSRPGTSLVPLFDRDGSIEARDLWWLHEGNRAIRSGDWKLVAHREQPWELYDLASDPTETTNLAADHPMRVEALERRWQDRWESILRTATERLQE